MRKLPYIYIFLLCAILAVLFYNTVDYKFSDYHATRAEQLLVKTLHANDDLISENIMLKMKVYELEKELNHVRAVKY